MFATRILFTGHIGTVLLLLLISVQVQTCTAQTSHLCAPSSCGNIRNLSSPFRLKGDPPNCGYSFYELACEKNQTFLHLYSGKYIVQSINYNNSTIRVVDAGVSKDNCSSLPQYPLTITNFSYGDSYNPPISLSSFGEESQMLMMFMKCANPVKSPLYVNTAPCINGTYSYVLIKSNITYVDNLCKVELIAISSMPIRDYRNISYMDIHKRLVYGFELSWNEIYCVDCKGEERCYLAPQKI